MQLNDRREGRFNPEFIRFFESLAGNIGLALKRKQAEEALQKSAEELARSNQELNQFASVVSHDLQEPLRTVRGFVQLLQKKYAKQLDAEADSFIEFAVDGTTRMETLIKDLLAYARVGTRGKQPVPIDAGAALRQALDNLSASIQEAGAEVTHGQLPTVRADPSQLPQLFQNLLGNAHKVPRPSAAEDSRGRLPGRRLLAILRARQRHRHRPQTARRNLRGVSTLAHPETVRRHGHRPGDLQEDRGPPRRANLGRVATGTGRHLQLYTANVIEA